MRLKLGPLRSGEQRLEHLTQELFPGAHTQESVHWGASESLNGILDQKSLGAQERRDRDLAWVGGQEGEMGELVKEVF